MTFYYFDMKKSIKALLDIFWEDEKTKLAVLNIYGNNGFQVGLYNQSYEPIEKSNRCNILCIKTSIKTVSNKSKKFSILNAISVQNVQIAFLKIPLPGLGQEIRWKAWTFIS